MREDGLGDRIELWGEMRWEEASDWLADLFWIEVDISPLHYTTGIDMGMSERRTSFKEFLRDVFSVKVVVPLDFLSVVRLSLFPLSVGEEPPPLTHFSSRLFLCRCLSPLSKEEDYRSRTKMMMMIPWGGGKADWTHSQVWKRERLLSPLSLWTGRWTSLLRSQF